MPVNPSIEDVPDDPVQRLRAKAAHRHRSWQGELLAIIEEATRADRPATADGVLAEVRRLGSSTPAEAAEIIRADRDGRSGGR